jgi:hypothetical protein
MSLKPMPLVQSVPFVRGDVPSESVSFDPSLGLQFINLG